MCIPTPTRFKALTQNGSSVIQVRGPEPAGARWEFGWVWLMFSSLAPFPTALSFFGLCLVRLPPSRL
jgi:hypothetical protein